MERMSRKKSLRMAVFTLLLMLVFLPIAFSAAPNPGHSWSQIECTANLSASGGLVGTWTAAPDGVSMSYYSPAHNSVSLH